MEKIGAFILYTGQPEIKIARKSIEDQVDEVIVIDRVSPVNKAIQLCFKLGQKFDWFLIFGADTVQHPLAIETYLKYKDKKYWSICGRLKDYYRDDYINHFYNAEAVKDYKVSDGVNYDHEIHIDMIAKGYDKIITEQITGFHHPSWTPHDAFEKHLHSGKRYPDHLRYKFLKQIIEKCLDDPRRFNIASLMGFTIGVMQGNPRPLDGKTSKEWETFKELFK